MFERLAIQNLLPQQKNFLTLKIIRNLTERLSPSEKETKEYELRITFTSENSSRINWNQDKVDLLKIETDIEIGEIATNIIVEILKKKDKEDILLMGEYTIYEKFVEGKDLKKGKK